MVSANLKASLSFKVENWGFPKSQAKAYSSMYMLFYLYGT